MTEMDSNVQGVILSFVFVFAILAVGKGLMVFVPGVSSEFIRKFVHVSVSNWWFIMVTFFTRLPFLVLGPIFFIIFNGLATFLSWAAALGMNDRGRNYGLIYFPISLLVLVLMFSFGYIPQSICGMGFFSMGYGDGFAAIIGKMFGTRTISEISGRKTCAGSLAMFAVSVMVFAGFSVFYGLRWLNSPRGIILIVVNGAIATLLEAMTPCGLDNLTVPIGTTISIHLMSKAMLLNPE
jgi:phytol kinase